MFTYTAVDGNEEVKVDFTPSGNDIRIQIADIGATLSKQQMGELGIFLYAMSNGIDEDSICELLDGYFGEDYLLR